MRMQDSQANCGSTAMHNALAALGIRRSTHECEALCGVTATEGTSSEKLVAALERVRGCKPQMIDETREAVATVLLVDALRRGRPVIMSVDNGQHYVAAVGLVGERVLVADGAKNELVVSYLPARFALRWEDRTTPNVQYWGIIV